MHPGMIAWWRARHEARCGSDCGEGAGWGHHRGHWRGHHGHHAHPGHGHHGHPGRGHHGDGGEHDEVHASGVHEHDDWGGGPLGVRRPLRFLAHKLQLQEAQVAELAKILDDLKTERAQVAVDHRRTTSSFADLLAGEAFDEGQARSVGDERVKSAERLREALVKALGRLHTLLDKGQRERLAYLLRTGALMI